MQPNPDFRRTALPGPRRGPLATLLAGATGIALVVLGFTFSLLILAAAAVIGLLGFSALWWKTRQLRRQVRERMAEMERQSAATPGPGTPSEGGTIIEGEVIHEERETRR